MPSQESMLKKQNALSQKEQERSTSNKSTRLQPDKRREQILDVASIHFARYGYEAVSMRTIASDAGVARTLLYHYFPGKDALLEAVLLREAEGLLAATAPDPERSLRQNLEHALDAYFDHYLIENGALRILYAPNPLAPTLVRELVEKNHAVQIQRLLAFLQVEDTPLRRVALGSWLVFVAEVVRESNGNTTIARSELVQLCIGTLVSVTGIVIEKE